MIDDRFFFCPLFRKIDTNLRNFDFSDNRIYAGIPAQDHHNGGGCPPHQGRWRLPPKAFLSPKEVVTMISIDTVIAVITLVITSVGLGLQFASYMNTKNNRRSQED